MIPMSAAALLYDPKIRRALAYRALAQKIADALYVLDYGCVPPIDFRGPYPPKPVTTEQPRPKA